MKSGVRSQQSAVRRTLAFLGLAVGVVALASLLPGCGKPPKITDDGKDKAGAQIKPWESAGKRLRRETDAPAVKSVLGTLNNDLAAADNVPKPAPLAKGAEDALAALVPLSPEDRAEIREPAFSAHDPVHVAECLLFRDAAISLDPPARPGQSAEQTAADRADLGFAWVCRQVYLNPWMMQTAEGLTYMPPVPPTYVLRRGYGSGLERAYVFLALLQQMGLDGCLVGPPDAGGKSSTFIAFGPDKKTVLTGSPRGPFWAVGVRVGGDVRVYDPWRGVPFPATLGALKANPEAHKAWFEAKENVTGVTAEDAKAATVFLAAPVNSLSPRMAMLEQQLKADVGARLATDPAALRNAFPDPKPAFWNPPTDPFAYGRVARSFLPVDEGGTDRSPRGLGRLYDAYVIGQLPAEVFRVPELGTGEDAMNRVRQIIAGGYGAAFFDPPNPRERIARGQFQEAARDLVAKQDRFAQGLERLRNNRDAEQQLRVWAKTGLELYGELGVARSRRDPAAIQAAEQAVEQHWRGNAQVVQLLLDRVSSGVGVAEATLLLALCKHEEAERIQARLERAAGPDAESLKRDAAVAWSIAAGEWQTYAGRASAQAGFPGRAAHVRALTERAEKLAGKK